MSWTMLVNPIAGLLDKLIPDPVAREKAKLELLKAENQQALSELQISMSAILAEAQSEDKWTSRARPSFMYLFYLVIVTLVIVAPFVGIFSPAGMEQFFKNVGAGFKAIPESLWDTFAIGYVGYAGARSWEKVKGKN